MRSTGSWTRLKRPAAAAAAVLFLVPKPGRMVMNSPEDVCFLFVCFPHFYKRQKFS